MRLPEVDVYELIALAVGAGLGLTSKRFGRRAWSALICVGSCGTGVIVSSLSGELSTSWGFLVFDVGQVAVAAVCAAAVIEALDRRARTAP
jgi:hypothetical protein